MKPLADLLHHSPSFRQLRKQVASGDSPVVVTGVHGSAHAYLLANLYDALPRKTPLLCVFPTQTEARKTFHDLFAFGAERVGFFPLLPDVLGEGSADSRKSLRAERIESLAILRTGGIIVASVYAVCQRLPPLAAFETATLTLHVGGWFDFKELAQRLANAGYRRVETVDLKGEFAVRGGIVDVFPLTSEHPLRIEFFGDEIESIRVFDETTQRSLRSVDSAILLPVKEFALTDQERRTWLKETARRYAEAPSTRLRTTMEALTETLFETGTLADIETYYPFLFPDGRSLLDYVPSEGRLYLSEPKWMEREMSRFAEKYDRLAEDARQANQLWVRAEEAFLPFDAVLQASERIPSVISLFSPSDAEATITFRTEPIVEQKGNLQKFLEGVRHWNEEGYHLAIFGESEKASLQMREILEDHALLSPAISFHLGVVSEGFASDEWRLVAISQEEIFGQRQSRHRQSRFRDGKPLLSFVELQEGDYVVHVTHGIARYTGIKRLRVDQNEYDFLALQYAGGDILYVPTHNINLVQKYIGGDNEKGPPLDRLGGFTWNRKKARVQQSVEKLAKELLALYAARQTTKGHAFAPDSPWQREFEAAFPYEETPDQYRAIEEVKRDMELPRPMDRLLCGDVGYGKTEVALRAAFKAVMDAKQVAVLVPTTVLAQQHYYTFVERMRDYPVRVRLLSRFASPKEIAITLEMLKKGTCDIVIGTHRLLSEDVKFRDLGLLIIDEEHRFGVRHKERLKELRHQVDVLTMTATPIPRTLHMSLTGVRDLSVINTPPENRLPIETYVMEYKPEIVREAILRELGRGGQVYVVSNRVESIESVAQNLRELVPQARIEVAHGQMSERTLERVMMRFIRHEFDVLVCTTIIESGLDIPNVNTILIYRADMLGLAQLYQLRGRVGRSDRRAYGYLFYPEDRAITEQSQKRLRVIEEFTELGSGFKIALRDMEIRGVGNLLGPQQHGHIAAVGYDLYCKLLENALAAQKGETVEEEIETFIRLPVSAYLPDEYVLDATAKIVLYKRIAAIRNRNDYHALEAELIDRYGAVPEPVRNLLDVALLKALASRLGITSVSYAEGRVVFTVDEKRAKLDPERLVALVREYPGVRLIPPSCFSVPAEGAVSSASLETLFHLLGRLGAVDSPYSEEKTHHHPVSET